MRAIVWIAIEYADVFALNNECLGRTSVFQHEIPTAPPVCQQFHQMCQQKRQEIRDLLSEMLEKDILQPSSPWASLVVLVKKKDGTNCFYGCCFLTILFEWCNSVFLTIG